MYSDHINTRLSYERRVKLIFMCCFPILAAFILFAATAYSENYTEPSGRTNILRTSVTEDNFSVIEAAGNKIEARGKYSSLKLRKMFVKHLEDTSGSYSMNAHSDGSYDAALTLAPETGAYTLILQMDNGLVMQYRVFYGSTGWYFPLNGYEKTNRDVFEHIYDAPAAAAALYLSASANGSEISTALEQIKAITDSITEGIEDDYEKARIISEFVAGRIYYDNDAKETNVDLNTVALYNVLRTDRTTCAGFANLFCAMAEAAGIDAVNIKGGVITENMAYEELNKGIQNHEFSAFYYEKESRWVWVDTCWDGSGTYEDGRFSNEIKVRPMFFDITDEAFSQSHRADKAERRRYFDAAPETASTGSSDEDTGAEEEKEEQQDKPAAETQTTEPAKAETAADTTETPETKPDAVTNADGTVICVIIAILGAGVIAAGAILIKIIINGRNNRNGNNRT
ncbi:MAG: hypothetical protein II820_02230 [Ruminiclostridium sp.]|nr:hypothetical protein [Ruminiclostridium sp.]